MSEERTLAAIVDLAMFFFKIACRIKSALFRRPNSVCHFSSMKRNFRILFTKLIQHGAIVQKEKRRNVVFFISGQMTLKTITVVTFEYLMNVKKI
ncbi:hypothetical protein CXH12_23870 [Citrobacter portucalensis]|nr:hypothetical protein [Salmonella enterica subsp. enterica serovar Senftenberg]EGE1470678.1 hypothetical protein [Escherichia coli]EGT4256231.1 hypothetical protein [Citrobacter amalonaticus]PKQ47047.1 hypothetical protein CXH12_23870 [Citrobacter portucalensis]